MTYYQVKPEYDGKTLYKKCGDRGYRNGYRIPNGYNLIANELLTGKEVEKLNVPQMCVDPVNIKKTETYFCFGARFQVEKEAV